MTYFHICVRLNLETLRIAKRPPAHDYFHRQFSTMLVLALNRICRPEVFYKKDVLKNFANFTEKNLRQSLFFNKVAGLRPATLLKKTSSHRCFPVNFAKFLRPAFL